MINKYRLMSNVYDRENEEEKVEPLKIFFLSVEGNVTEKEYFNGVSINREYLGINSRIDVEVLKRSSKDTNSAPKQVIELLEEYIRLRELEQQDFLDDIPKEFVEKYSEEFIRNYLNDSDSIPRKQKNAFLTDLTKIGYDINYRKYLKKYNNKFDEFGILIDRDKRTHSEVNMKECIDYCRQRNYSCFIANPCFEFWLLLHLSDVKEEYKNCLDMIKENRKISGNHTYVSNELTKRARHGKSGINFNQNYLPNVDIAIKRAKQFANDEETLVHEIGCNVWMLLEKMKEE